MEIENITNYLDDFCGSRFWDANLTWYTEEPDLTPCVEKTVLLWLPALVLLLFLPLELCRFSRSRTKHIPWSTLNVSKLVVLGLLMAVCVANLIIVTQRENSYPADIAAPVVQFATFMAAHKFLMMTEVADQAGIFGPVALMLVLVFVNKTHGLRVSYLLFITSLCLVICQTPQIYSFIRAYLNLGIADSVITSLNVAVYILECVLFILQFFCDKPPLYCEYPNLERPSPEVSASVLSRLLFMWFSPLVKLGAQRPLQATDMYSLEHENSSRVIVSQFDRHWLASIQKVQKPKMTYDKRSSKVGFYRTVRPKASLLPALLKTFSHTFFLGGILKLCQDLIMFINPQLIKRLIGFVSSEESFWHGCMYASLMLLSSLVQMIIQNQSFMIMNFTGTRVCTALISIIYRKSLKLSNAARKESTVGEVVNLMAVDASSFQHVIVMINLVWSAPLQIILALVFLWDLLGPAVLAGLALMVLMIPANAWLIRQNRRLRITQMKYKDERIKTMNEVFSGVKVLKLYAWEPSFEERISKIRQKEINVLRSAAYYNTVSNFVFSLTPYLVALASFSYFVLSDNRNILDAQTAFVSLSLFNIMRMPLGLLPQLFNTIVMASVSLKRINKFLNNEELDPGLVTHEPSEGNQIVVENGTFSWDGSDDSDVVLRNINLQVPTGALVAVVGTVGSGKSSLISAILGELDKLSGKVNTKGSIAYVPQLPWMQNATLRGNITCIREFENSKFNRVVKACALEQDLEMLPGGDMTEIGEKGINLSGGQKQRISLARAVYSNADVYLLDDPLSAVDAHVGKHIFENVIGSKGMLRNKTRVLVTHSVTFLPEADFIVVLKDGQVSESGSYHQLVQNKGPFADFLLHYLEQVDDLDGVPDLQEITKELLKDSTLRERYMRAISVRSEGSNISSPLKRQTSRESTSSAGKGSKTSLNNSTSKPDKRKLMTIEEAATGNVKLGVYAFYFKAVGILTGVLAVGGALLYQACQVSTNLWLSKWTSDNTTVVNGTQDMAKTHMYLTVYGSLGVFQAISNVISNLSMSLGCLFAASWLHRTMLDRILRAPMSFFDTTPLGRIVNRFSKDIDTCDSVLSFNLTNFLSLTITIIGVVSVITYSTPVFIFVIIPIMIYNLLLQRYFLATSRQLKRLESITRSPVYSHFSETIQGVQSIRAYGMQEFFTSHSEQKVDINQSCNFPNIVAMRWLAIRLESVSNLVVFFAALFVVIYRGTIEPGLAGLSITYALQVTQNLNFFVRNLADVETNIVAVERIKEYTEMKKEAAWSVEPKPEPSWPQRGEVDFRHYQLRYREGLDLVLAGVTFTIHPCEKIGIVGRTGAGKSSLTLGLFRLLEAAGGSIYIDGINIAALGLHDLRSRLTIIPQDPVLFSGTLRSNLDPFEKESDEMLWNALELSNLKEFVSGLNNGLSYIITEGGENLSVGQKQLICLSRALLRKSRVLILDEATAAVDLETDDIIQNTIRTEFKDCTVLTIAHRLNTIMDYDRILVLDKGKVKEFDAPSVLLRDSGSVFYSMAKDAGLA